jgi:hypothetical protein
MKTLKHTWFKLILIGGFILGANATLAAYGGHNNGHISSVSSHSYSLSSGHNSARGYERQWSPGRSYSSPVTSYAPSRGYDPRWSLNLNRGVLGYAPGYVSPVGRSYSRPYYSYSAPPVVVRAAPPVIVRNNAYIATAPVMGPSLFRDAYGRCYTVRYDALGNAFRTEIPALACNF